MGTKQGLYMMPPCVHIMAARSRLHPQDVGSEGKGGHWGGCASAAMHVCPAGDERSMEHVDAALLLVDLSY